MDSCKSTKEAPRGTISSLSTRDNDQNDRPNSESGGDDVGTIIANLRPNDVLLGRGTGPNEFMGNIRYRKLVRDILRRACSPSTPGDLTESAHTSFIKNKKTVGHHEDTDEKSPSTSGASMSVADSTLLPKGNKSELAATIVRAIKERNGRFLQRLSGIPVDGAGKGSTEIPDRYRYMIVDDDVAIEKTKQTFRHQMKIIERDNLLGNNDDPRQTNPVAVEEVITKATEEQHEFFPAAKKRKRRVPDEQDATRSFLNQAIAPAAGSTRIITAGAGGTPFLPAASSSANKTPLTRMLSLGASPSVGVGWAQQHQRRREGCWCAGEERRNSIQEAAAVRSILAARQQQLISEILLKQKATTTSSTIAALRGAAAASTTDGDADGELSGKKQQQHLFAASSIAELQHLLQHQEALVRQKKQQEHMRSSLSLPGYLVGVPGGLTTTPSQPPPYQPPDHLISFPYQMKLVQEQQLLATRRVMLERATAQKVHELLLSGHRGVAFSATNEGGDTTTSSSNDRGIIGSPP